MPEIIFLASLQPILFVMHYDNKIVLPVAIREVLGDLLVTTF